MLPGRLEYSRLVDANAEDASNGPINSVQFHRNAQLLLAAGFNQKLRFFFRLMANRIPRYKVSSLMIAPFERYHSCLIGLGLL